MNKYLNKSNQNVDKLYNKILFLSRNNFFYTKISLKDTFQNRISLIFLHISFLFVKKKESTSDSTYKNLFQKLFDHTFDKIELNMREIGYGDVVVNKNMKFLVKNFYNILLNCEKYTKENDKNKKLFLYKYLEKNDVKENNTLDLIAYFDKYNFFCLDLSQDSVLKGELNFITN